MSLRIISNNLTQFLSKNEKIIWEKQFFELDDSVTYLVDINLGGVSLEEIREVAPGYC